MASRDAHDFAGGETPSSTVFDSMPGGWIGHNHRTNPQGGVGASDVQILTVDVTVNAGRYITCTVQAEIGGGSAGTCDVAVRIFRDGTLMGRGVVTVNQSGTTGANKTVTVGIDDFAPAQGNHTYSATARVESGGVTDAQVNVQPGIDCRMIVRDEGSWP